MWSWLWSQDAYLSGSFLQSLSPVKGRWKGSPKKGGRKSQPTFPELPGEGFPHPPRSKRAHLLNLHLCYAFAVWKRKEERRNEKMTPLGCHTCLPVMEVDVLSSELPFCGIFPMGSSPWDHGELIVLWQRKGISDLLASRQGALLVWNI